MSRFKVTTVPVTPSRFKVTTVPVKMMENPLTGKPIAENGPTASKLKKEGYVLDEFKGDTGLHGINKYEFDPSKKLGEGGFGAVYNVIEKATGKEYAMKIIKLRDEKHLNKVKDEINILNNQKLDCALGLKEAFIHDGKIHIVTSYYNEMNFDDYQQHIDTSPKKYTLLEKKYRYLLKCIDDLHSEGIYHRDIKPENIVHSKGEPRLIDFGLSVDMKINPDQICSGVGTPNYWSKFLIEKERKKLVLPEEVCEKLYKFQDYWCLILTFYYMIIGEDLVERPTLPSIIKAISLDDFSLLDESDEPLVRIINKVLETVKTSRTMTMGELQIPEIRSLMDLEEWI